MIPAIGLALLLAAAPSDSTPSCAADLAMLDRKMHDNYAGYMLELRGDHLRQFATMKAMVQQRADSVSGDGCFFAKIADPVAVVDAALAKRR